MANLPDLRSDNHKILTNLLMIAYLFEIRKLKFANPFKSVNWIILSRLTKLNSHLGGGLNPGHSALPAVHIPVN